MLNSRRTRGKKGGRSPAAWWHCCNPPNSVLRLQSWLRSWLRNWICKTWTRARKYKEFSGSGGQKGVDFSHNLQDACGSRRTRVEVRAGVELLPVGQLRDARPVFLGGGAGYLRRERWLDGTFRLSSFFWTDVPENYLESFCGMSAVFF